MKISAVLIVKNESSCLEKCLKTLNGFDEIIVCDTGSEDNTIEIAKKFTDKVFDDFKWCDNFSKARNHALGKATGDWILSIDADEELLNTVEDIKKVVAIAEEKNVKAVDVIQISGRNTNPFPRLFKRCPEVYWNGAIHNHLSVVGGIKSDIKIRYDYSEAHKLDPDRTLRILKKEVAERPDCGREKYYLGREYWYRKDYITAIYWFDEYLMISKWMPEKADAYLYVARCYWALKKGDTARNYCLQALNINANFKEALRFMGELSWEVNRKRWNEFSELADNTGVLFDRTNKPKPVEPKEPIEVCFLVYQRPQRVPDILRQLKVQTLQNFKVNIWNNSGVELDVSDFPQDKIKVINSEENLGSKVRFKLAKQTTGNPIIFFDDDENLDTNFIEYNYNEYLKFGSKCILGWFARTFSKESYWDSIGAKYGEKVDYVGTGGMILDREIIDKEPLLQNIPKPFKKVEDLYLCYLARMNHGMEMIKIEPTCSILVDDKDQYKSIDKEGAFKELRTKGWELLRERNRKQDACYWDERYKNGNSGVGSYGDWLKFKLEEIKKIKGVSSILDVGCGDLNTGTQVASLFPKSTYLGLDISKTALQQAKERKLDKRFSFKLMEDSVFSYPSDLVLCLDVLWHINREKDYNDLLKSLKKSWKKHLFLTAHKEDYVNENTASHVKIREFDPIYFSKDYKKYLIPVGDKNIYLYHFSK